MAIDVAAAAVDEKVLRSQRPEKWAVERFEDGWSSLSKMSELQSFLTINTGNHCTSLTVIRGRGNCPARKRLKLVSVTGLNLLGRVRKLCSSTVFMISSGHLHITPLLTPLWLSPPQRWHWRSALDVNDDGERGAVVPVVNGEETL